MPQHAPVSPSRFLLQTNLQHAQAVLASCADLHEPLSRAASLVGSAIQNGAKVLACGNGGSAADAMHLTTEFVCRFKDDRKPYPAICLNASGGDLTAIGNDYGFDQVFARQVHAFGRKGDVLLVFTTSGNSGNVLHALEAARQIGIASVAFLGRGGGHCVSKADVDLIVPGDVAVARIQEAHKVLLHTLCELVEAEVESARP